LWKSPLRSQITGNMSIGTGINTLKSNIKMRQAQLTRNLLNFSNNRLGGFMSKRLNKTLDRQLNSAASYDAKANSASNTNVAASSGRTAGKIRGIYGA